MTLFNELKVMVSTFTKALCTDEFKQTFDIEAILNDILALGSCTASLRNTIKNLENAERNLK
jgi:hypothetical protein